MFPVEVKGLFATSYFGLAVSGHVSLLVGVGIGCIYESSLDAPRQASPLVLRVFSGGGAVKSRVVGVDVLVHMVFNVGNKALSRVTCGNVVGLLCACVGMLHNYVVDGITEALGLDSFVDVDGRLVEVVGYLYSGMDAVLVRPNYLAAGNEGQ